MGGSHIDGNGRNPVKNSVGPSILGCRYTSPFGRLRSSNIRKQTTQSCRSPACVPFLLDDLADTKKIAVQIDNGKFLEAPRFVF